MGGERSLPSAATQRIRGALKGGKSGKFCGMVSESFRRRRNGWGEKSSICCNSKNPWFKADQDNYKFQSFDNLGGGKYAFWNVGRKQYCEDNGVNGMRCRRREIGSYEKYSVWEAP